MQREALVRGIYTMSGHGYHGVFYHGWMEQWEGESASKGLTSHAENRVPSLHMAVSLKWCNEQMPHGEFSYECHQGCETLILGGRFLSIFRPSHLKGNIFVNGAFIRVESTHLQNTVKQQARPAAMRRRHLEFYGGEKPFGQKFQTSFVLACNRRYLPCWLIPIK